MKKDQFLGRYFASLHYSKRPLFAADLTGHPKVVEYFKRLKADPNLKEYKYDASVSFAGMPALAELIRANKNLQSLIIPEIRFAGLGILGLPQGQKLEPGQFERCDKAVQTVLDAIAESDTLKSLTINTFTQGTAAYLGDAIARNKGITELTLGDCWDEKGDAWEVLFSRILNKSNGNIRVLNICGSGWRSGDMLDDIGAVALANNTKPDNGLRILNIAQCYIGDLGGAAIAEMAAKHHTLERLNLNRNRIGKTGVFGNTFAKNKSLREIIFSCDDRGFMDFDEAAAADMAKGLKENSGITSFHALSNNCGIKGMTVMLDSLKGKPIVALSIGGEQDEGSILLHSHCVDEAGEYNKYEKQRELSVVWNRESNAEKVDALIGFLQTKPPLVYLNFYPGEAFDPPYDLEYKKHDCEDRLFGALKDSKTLISYQSPEGYDRPDMMPEDALPPDFNRIHSEICVPNKMAVHKLINKILRNPEDLTAGDIREIKERRAAIEYVANSKGYLTSEWPFLWQNLGNSISLDVNGSHHNIYAENLVETDGKRMLVISKEVKGTETKTKIVLDSQSKIMVRDPVTYMCRLLPNGFDLIDEYVLPVKNEENVKKLLATLERVAPSVPGVEAAVADANIPRKSAIAI